MTIISSSSHSGDSSMIESLSPEEKARTVLVSRLDPRATEYTILQLTKPFGSIESHEFWFYSFGNKKGQPQQCFVTFKDRESALRCREGLDGLIPDEQWKYKQGLSCSFMAIKTGRVSETWLGRKQQTSQEETSDDVSSGDKKNVDVTVESLSHQINIIKRRLIELEEEDG